MVTEKFKKLACSFYGCDGGNPESRLWICGLEWGGGFEDNIIPEDTFSPENEKLLSWNIDEANAILYGKGMGFNQKLAWFYAYYLDWKIERYAEAAIENKLFFSQQANGIGLKLNAFPISFKDRNSTQWNSDLINKTGLISFYEYRHWCVTHRGEFFKRQIQKYNPQVIVCIGKTSWEEFFSLFKCDTEFIDDKGIKYSTTNNGKTRVYVVPFFGGANGINSYDRMKTLVVKIRKTEEQFSNPYLG